MTTRQSERGAALLLALITLLLALALGAGLVLSTSAEALMARHFQVANEALYAAEAAAEFASDELAALPNWDDVLRGVAAASVVDGAPSGTRTLADGSTVDLDAVISLANCQRLTPCSVADMDLVTPERPWGPNNPRWRLFAWGPLNALPGLAGASPFYVTVLVGDDPGENDSDPLTDGGPPGGGLPANPGRHKLVVRAEATGSGHTRRTVEVTVARSVTRLTWREVP